MSTRQISRTSRLCIDKEKKGGENKSMKSYVIHPINTLNEERLRRSQCINVVDTIEGARIWIDSWYFEDCDIFEIEYKEGDTIEIVEGTTQLEDLSIVKTSWRRIKSFDSIKKIGEIRYK